LTPEAGRVILRAFMRRLAAAALLAALAACGTSHCQDLGQRICACQPGLDSSTCKTQVENLLKVSGPGEGKCAELLSSCSTSNPNAPAGVDLCEWMLTDAGRFACGLSTQ
jgi:hypothetical protein